jgi:hypothetical protein
VLRLTSVPEHLIAGIPPPGQLALVQSLVTLLLPVDTSTAANYAMSATSCRRRLEFKYSSNSLPSNRSYRYRGRQWHQREVR